MKYRVIVMVLLVLIFANSGIPVLAEKNSSDNAATPPNKRELRDKITKQVREETKDLKQKIRKEVNDTLKEELKNITPSVKKELNIWERLTKNMVANFTGIITKIEGNILTVANGDKSINVQTDGKTIFRRHFWGKAILSEFAEKNKINVLGKFTDDTKSTVQARYVRNLSIMKRFGTFIGTVSDLNGSTFTLNTAARGNEKVTLTSETKCLDRKEQTMKCSDIKNGERLKVVGLWDKTNKTITEVAKVKDFDVPVKPTVTVTPTP